MNMFVSYIILLGNITARQYIIMLQCLKRDDATMIVAEIVAPNKWLAINNQRSGTLVKKVSYTIYNAIRTALQPLQKQSFEGGLVDA